MSYLSGPFLWALAAAAGPIIIHLLSRQRQVTIDWAAMDFLLRAVKRRRRRLQLRDLILLLLRTAAIIFFVMAMARPIWTRIAGLADKDEPIHAIIALDNSLSMSHTTMDRTLLDAAKDRIGRFLRTLPSGSDISLIPMCSQSDFRSSGVFDSHEDAIESLARINVVDRKARLDSVLSAMHKAAEQPGTIAIKRYFVVSDMQLASWRDQKEVEQLAELGDLQLIEVGTSDTQVRDNSWVESFTLRDGYAEVGEPSIFDATLRHEGAEARSNVRVVLTVDKDTVAEQLVDLKPGDEKNISFEYTFPLPGGVVDPALVPVRIEMESDALTADDTRHMIAPIFRREPILFIDQFGGAESYEFDRLGETLPLRWLFQSHGARAGGSARDSQPRHITLGDLQQEDLSKTRIVVLAGIDAPTPESVQMLRTFVERGGQLLIAAGGDFNSGLWSNAASDLHEGILPVPLRSEMLGRCPQTPGDRVDVFRLEGESLDREIFEMDLSSTQWDDLVAAPFFYQAVLVADPAEGDPSDDSTQDASVKSQAIDQGVEKTRIVGRYSNGEPFVVHRRIGNGNILFLTTSIFPNWNNVAVEPKGSILLYDQMLRWLLRQSLASHTYVERKELTVSVDRREQDRRFELITPGSKDAQPLAVEAVGQDDFALIVRDLDRRGIYSIRQTGSDHSKDAGEFYTFAIGGPSDESDLSTVTESELGASPGSASEASENESIVENKAKSLIWIESNEPISLLGGSLIGYDLWLYLLIAAILCLVAEMAVAAGPIKNNSAEEVSS